MNKIKVLVVDDSALVRQVLTSILEETPDIEVVGTAANPLIAREKIKKLNPDVLTLDVEMPKMDGVTFLANLMRLRPMPVVMVSVLTEKGAEITLRALELGAVDFVAKPKLNSALGLKIFADDISQKVRVAARARVRPLETKANTEVKSRVIAENSADPVCHRAENNRIFRTTDKIIAIGASTGGTEAIKDVLRDIPADIRAAFIVTQHIPAAFSTSFAKRVNNITDLEVCEAVDGQKVLPGHVYISPGDRHLLIDKCGADFVCRLSDGPLVNRHKPSVEVMLRSLAQHANTHCISLMLTGMGSDGAEATGGLKRMGVPILVQDEKSSVVWGMPGEVYKRGYADEVVSLGKIGTRLQQLVAQG